MQDRARDSVLSDGNRDFPVCLQYLQTKQCSCVPASLGQSVASPRLFHSLSKDTSNQSRIRIRLYRYLGVELAT